jgi:hypothetical protein
MKKHAEQVAAWGKLLGHCNALGDSYKPSKESVNRAAMENLLNESVKQVETVHNAETFLANAITERQEAFSKLPIIGTRVVQALEANGASLERVNDVNAIRKRFRPKRTGRAIPSETSGKLAAQINGDTDSLRKAAHTVRHLDFHSKVDNLQLLINQLENGAAYATSLADISIEGLKQLLASLKQHNEKVAQAHLQLHLARKKRDELLYSTNGMHTMSRMVKKYFLSAYGFNSTEAKMVRKIKFKR